MGIIFTDSATYLVTYDDTNQVKYSYIEATVDR